MDEWLKSAEASKILGINLDTLRQLTLRGLVPARRIPGAHARYRRSDIERIAAEADQAPIAAGGGE
jgi:predicted site-specific integrase-resolvase